MKTLRTLGALLLGLLLLGTFKATAQTTVWKLDGVDDCATFKSSGSSTRMIGNGNFTWEMWIKVDAISSNDQALVTMKRDSDTYWTFGIFGNSAGSNSGKLYFGGRKSSTQSDTTISSIAIPVGTWTHVAVVRKYNSNRYIYVDGTLVAHNTVNYGSDHRTADYVAMGAFVATTGSTPTYSNHFNGSIAELRIWKQFLIQNQVVSYMNKPADASIHKATKLAAYYPFTNNTFETYAPTITSQASSVYDLTFEGGMSANYQAEYPPMPYQTVADGNWSDPNIWGTGQGVPPYMSGTAKISNNVHVDTDVSMYNLLVDTLKTLTIDTTQTLFVRDVLTLKGNLVIEDRGSFSQGQYRTLSYSNLNYENNITGQIIYKRKGQQSQNAFNIWSLPFPSYQTSDFSSNAYAFNSTTQAYESNTGLQAGEGVLAMGDPLNPLRTFTGGELNNGNIKVSVKKNHSSDSWNLLGNPYPSALDLIQFLQYNGVDRSRIVGTAYLWDDDNSGGSGWSSADYASITTLGGTAATGGGHGHVPNGVIGSGQGFWIEAGYSSTVDFYNYMRVTGQNETFFKADKSKRQLMWLDVTNTFGEFNQLLVGFDPEASDDYDNALDGYKLEGNANISFSSYLDGDKMAIQAFDNLEAGKTKSLRLNLFTFQAGEHAISLSNLENMPSEYALILEDKHKGEKTNLRTKDYKFDVDSVSNFTDRFFLHITYQVENTGGEELNDGLAGGQPTQGLLDGDSAVIVWEDNATTAVEEAEPMEESFRYVGLKNGVAMINMEGFEEGTISVYNLAGQEIYTAAAPVGSKKFEIVNQVFTAGAYILKYSASAETFSGKVYVR